MIRYQKATRLRSTTSTRFALAKLTMKCMAIPDDGTFVETYFENGEQVQNKWLMLLPLKKDPILSWCLKSLISGKYIWQSSNIRLSRRYEFDAQVASFGTWHGSQCRADPWKSEVIRANVALQALETKKNRKGLKKWYAGNLCSKQKLKNSDCATFCRIPFMLSYVEFRIAGGMAENTSDVLVSPPDRSPELSRKRMPCQREHVTNWHKLTLLVHLERLNRSRLDAHRMRCQRHRHRGLEKRQHEWRNETCHEWRKVMKRYEMLRICEPVVFFGRLA